MNITIIGTGYVGLVTGACLAEYGHNVTCIDTNKEKIKLLCSGQSPIFEPGIEELLQRNIENHRLEFTTSLSHGLTKSDVLFLALGTPESEDGSADLSYVFSAAEQIALLSEKNLLLVLKSTVPVGTTEKIQQLVNKIIFEKRKTCKISVASNPEFLAEGTAVSDFLKPARIVIGVSCQEDSEILKEVYRPFVLSNPGKFLVMSTASSELTKYASNSMLALRISFMNELSVISSAFNANIDDIRIAMGADPRIGNKFLYAGAGFGGSCFPKDVRALIKTSETIDYKFKTLEAAYKVNAKRTEYLLDKISRHFKGELHNKNITVWGLSFKPKTDDLRESPAIYLIQALRNKGAKIFGHDPKSMALFMKNHSESDIKLFDNTNHSLINSDALVLMTEWNEYKNPNWDDISTQMREKTIFDFRNQWNYEDLKKRGFSYYGIGRPDSSYKEMNRLG